MKYTSATRRVSSAPKEHATLRAWIRSSNFPLFGTVIVNGDGWEVPSVLMTVTVIVRNVVDGRGSDRYMNGSNVIETFLHSGQINVDLNWPCNEYNHDQLSGLKNLSTNTSKHHLLLYRNTECYLRWYTN